MRASILAASMLGILASCSMTDFYPDGQIVEVQGERVLVRQLPGRAFGYHAVPNKPDPSTLVTRDPSINLKNIRAIEIVTGCTVIRDSIQHAEVNTFATVAC